MRIVIENVFSYDVYVYIALANAVTNAPGVCATIHHFKIII